jgi:hypothetical protein
VAPAVRALRVRQPGPQHGMVTGIKVHAAAFVAAKPVVC